MVEVYADGALVYSPTLPGYELLRLTATVKASAAGTAEIVMPASHPAYNSFTHYRTVVEIRRSGELIFRGRALYPEDNFNNERTIICEGERCFLRDAVMQPYLYQAAPDVIFADLIRLYNEQVDEFKQFVVGRITAKDPNDYVRLECESAAQLSEAVDKLVERVGGYVTFETNADGKRVINWLGTLDTESTQRIEFGENLLDFSRTGSNTDLATVIYPYGAADEETQERLTIEAVNGGKLYIQDDEAVALRGRIARPVFWDDVTLAKNLIRKARAWLDEHKQIVTTLELSAMDLSAVDTDIDALRVGELIHVYSEPHGLDDVYLLQERDYDLLNPINDSVVLGKDLVTLTGSDVSGDKQAAYQLQQTAQTLSQQQGSVTNTYIINGGGGEGGGAVDSVNGKTGVVVLTADDVGAVSTVNGQSGTVTLNADDVGAVSSVNGKTGAVVLGASSVGAVGAGQGTQQQRRLFGAVTAATGATITFADDPESYDSFIGRLAYVGIPPAALQGSSDAREIGISSISRYGTGLRIDYVSLVGSDEVLTKTVNIIRRVLIEADGTVKVSDPGSIAIGPLYGVKTV